MMTGREIYEAFIEESAACFVRGETPGVALLRSDAWLRLFTEPPGKNLVHLEMLRGIKIKIVPEYGDHDELRFLPSQEMIPRLNRWLAAGA